MSLLITSNRGGTCCICLGEFEDSDKPITHVGGEGHDGFHRNCLKKWVIRSPICPYDKQLINESSLISRTDKMIAKLKPALTNAAYAACFGIALSGLTAGVTAGVLLRIARVERIAQIGTAGVVLPILALAIQKAVGDRRAEALIGVLTAVMGGAGTAGITGKLIGEGGEVYLGVLTTGAAVGVTTKIGMDWILNRREVNWMDQETIDLGIHIGLLAGMTVGAFHPLAISPTTILVSGIAAGILSLIKR